MPGARAQPASTERNAPGSGSDRGSTRVEDALRVALPGYLALVWVATAAGAYAAYREHDGWRIGDWLISYAGGFVRRGLAGEAVATLSRSASVDPGAVVAALQVLLYGTFIAFGYLALRRRRVAPYLLLVLSPFVFTFQICDPPGGYRKEVLHLALLSLLVWLRLRPGRRVPDRVFDAALLAYPLLILSHEMLAVFLPYLLAVRFWREGPDRRALLVTTALCLPSAVALALSARHTGSAEQSRAIFEAVSSLGYPLKGGAVHWLQNPASYGTLRVRDAIASHGYLGMYPGAAVLAAVAFVPVRRRLAAVARRRAVAVPVLASLVGSLLLCAVALDWGRILYVNLASLFLLSLLPEEADPGRAAAPAASATGPVRRFAVVVVVAALVAAWASLWRIPHSYYGGRVLSRSLQGTNPARAALLLEKALRGR